MQTIRTESGTKYLLDKGSVQRAEPAGDNPLRNDGEWLPIIETVYPLEVGERWGFITENENGQFFRTSTPVVSIEEIS